MLVFETNDACSAFLKRFRFDEIERYINAADLTARIEGEDGREAESKPRRKAQGGGEAS